MYLLPRCSPVGENNLNVSFWGMFLWKADDPSTRMMRVGGSFVYDMFS